MTDYMKPNKFQIFVIDIPKPEPALEVDLVAGKRTNVTVKCQRPFGPPVNLISGQVSPGIEPLPQQYYIRKLHERKDEKESD